MTREQAINKIKKLQALKDGASKIESEGEASQAAKAIDRLQKEFGITMEEVYGSSDRGNYKTSYEAPKKESTRSTTTDYANNNAQQQSWQRQDTNSQASHSSNPIMDIFEENPNAKKGCLVWIASVLLLLFGIVGTCSNSESKAPAGKTETSSNIEYQDDKPVNTENYQGDEGRTYVGNRKSEQRRERTEIANEGLTYEDKANIKHVIRDWNMLHNSKYGYGNLSQLYNSTLSFYGQTLSADKADHMAMDAVYEEGFTQECRNIILTQLNNGDVRLDFTKKVYTYDGTNNYPSYLILKRSSRNQYGWSIIKESDKITDRNLNIE